MKISKGAYTLSLGKHEDKVAISVGVDGIGGHGIAILISYDEALNFAEEIANLVIDSFKGKLQ